MRLNHNTPETVPRSERLAPRSIPITVVKRNGCRETFNRGKLLHGLLRACEKTGLEPSRLELVG